MCPRSVHLDARNIEIPFQHGIDLQPDRYAINGQQRRLSGGFGAVNRQLVQPRRQRIPVEGERSDLNASAG